MTVTNSGTANLTISSALIGGTNSGDFATSADLCTGATVTPSSTCTLNVTFTPSAAGSRSASLNFTDNASNSPQTVSLMGTGTAPVAGVSPSSLTFGNQTLGTTSASQPVTLSNTGTANLTIASIATSAKFGEADNCAGSVAASGSCTINVTFSPSLTATAGTLTGALTVTDNNNGVAGSTQTVSLSGTAINPGSGLPPASVTDNEMITVTDTPIVVAMPPLLTFTEPVAYYSVGSLGFAGETGTLPLTVSNLGQANLSLVAVTPPGSPFTIAQIACTNGASSLPTTLPPAGACIFSISYVAPPSGTPTGTIMFTDNAGLSNVTSTVAGSNFTQSIPLSGAGTSTAPPSPPSTTVSVPVNETITVTDTPLVVAMPPLLTIAEPVAYYSVGSLGFAGQTQTLPLTVSNLGEANLSLVSVTPPVSPFSIAQIACTNGATSLPTTLQPAGACVFSISYVAPPSGTPTGTITFTDGAALSNLTSTAAGSNFTQSVPLSGAGTSTAPSSSPPTSVSVSVNETITVTDQVTATALTGNTPTGTNVTPSVTSSPGVPPVTVTFSNVTVAGNTTVTASTACSSGPSNFSGGIAGGAGVCVDVSTTAVFTGTVTITVSFNPANYTNPAALHIFHLVTGGWVDVTLSVNFTNDKITAVVTSLSPFGVFQGLPAVSLSVSSQNFGSLALNASSSAQQVTLTNTGAANLTVSTATLGGTNASDFAKSADNCTGATLTPNGPCTINVTFTPAATGARSATLTFTDNAANSPQTVALSGVGVDFAMASPTGTQTVTQGGPAQYTINVTSLGGTDSNAVTLACSNLPAQAACAFSPTTVTPGASDASSQLTITTAAPVYARMVPPSHGLPPARLLALLLATMLSVLVGWWRVRRKSPRWAAATCLLFGVLLATTFMAGCGGGGYLLPKVGGTPVGNYTVTVTGTFGSTQHTTTVTLNITAP